MISKFTQIVTSLTIKLEINNVTDFIVIIIFIKGFKILGAQ